jgi:hypothetical protein
MHFSGQVNGAELVRPVSGDNMQTSIKWLKFINYNSAASKTLPAPLAMHSNRVRHSSP